MEKHIKILGYLLVVWGVVVLGVALASLFVPGLARAEIRPNVRPIVIGINTLIAVFYVYSGWAVITRQEWARGAAIAGSVLALFRFPFGTALGVYGLWVAFSEPGRRAFGSYRPADRT